MDIGKIADQAKKLIDERGGMDALKEDALELKDIAQGEGSLTDRAKAAAEALQDPGEKGDQTPREAPREASRETPREPPPVNPAG